MVRTNPGLLSFKVLVMKLGAVGAICVRSIIWIFIENMQLSFTNIDSEKKNTIIIDLTTLNVKNMSRSILSSGSLQNHNTFKKPNKIEPKNFKVFTFKKGILEITIPSFSVLILEGKK